MEKPVPGTATADAVVNHVLGMLPPFADLTDPTVTDMGPEVSCPAVFLRIIVERARMATILERKRELAPRLTGSLSRNSSDDHHAELAATLATEALRVTGKDPEQSLALLWRAAGSIVLAGMSREAALTCMRIFMAELDAEVSRVQGAGQVRQ